MTRNGIVRVDQTPIGGGLPRLLPASMLLLVSVVAFLVLSPTTADARPELAKTLDRIDADPAGRIARELLQDDRSNLTEFEKELLRADVLLTSSRVRKAAESLSSGGRPSSEDLDVLIAAFRALKRNSAIGALRRQGLALKKRPRSLRRNVEQAFAPSAGASSSAHLPGKSSSGETASLRSAYGRLAISLSTPAGERLLGQARHALTSQRGIRHLAALPPLVLASLFPVEETDRFSSASSSASASSSCGESNATAGSAYPELQATLSVEKFVAMDRATDLAESLAAKVAQMASKTQFGSVPLPLNQRKAAELGVVIAAAGFGAPAASGAAAGFAGFEAALGGKELFDQLWDWGVVLAPSYLELLPGSAQVKPNQPVGFVACALDRGGHEAGWTSIGKLTISGHTPGFSSCDASHCSSTEVGTHAVTAEARGARGYATLTVEPGPLAALKLTPGYARIPADEQQKYEVRGVDDWGNDLGPIENPDSVSLSISTSGGNGGASCSQLTCSATAAGEYEVAASYRNSALAIGPEAIHPAYAKLEVTEVRRLTPGRAFVRYSQELEASQGVRPGSWHIVGGSLPDSATYPSWSSNYLYDGVLHVLTEETGEWRFTAEAVGVDGNPVKEAFALVIEPSGCASFPCAIPDGNRTFTFVWDADTCQACIGTMSLIFEATLAAPQYARELTFPDGCFGRERFNYCSFTFSFEPFAPWIPTSSKVTLYYEPWPDYANNVPIAGFQIAL